VPEWFPELAVAIAGQRWNDRSVFESVDRDQIIEKVKEQLNRESPGYDRVAWGRWFLADRSTRTISPFSKITTPEYIENRIKENTAESLDEVEQLAVGNKELLNRIATARAALPNSR
jgi:hypothetical protein